MEYEHIRDRIGLYSKYYGEMIETSFRLNQMEESYAALLVLFNTMELIFKSVRETDKKNLSDDIVWLKNNGFITDEEYAFLNDEDNGIRVLRNKMTHKDCYEYCIDIDNTAYPFADKDTWGKIFTIIFPQLLIILYEVICKFSE